MEPRTDRILPLSQDTDGTPRWRYKDNADGTILLQRYNGSTYVTIATIQSGSCSLGGGVDTTAIHKATAAEISAMTSVTPASDDILVIEDQSDSWNKKKVTVGSVSGVPGAHKTTHENGGTDEISVAALSGELADDQPPKAHAAAKHNGAVLTGTSGRPENLGPNYMDIDSLAEPAAPGSGIRRLWVDVADGHLKLKKADTTKVDLEAPATTDATAIHDNVAAEISVLTQKGTPAATDHLLIEDASDSNNKKRVTIGTLPYQLTSQKDAASGYAGLDASTLLSGDQLPAMSSTKRGGVPATGTPSNKVLRDDATWVAQGDSDALHKTVASEIHGLTDAAPASTDELVFEDASDSWNKKRCQVSDLGGTDADAIHDNVANEISAITEKTTPANDDLLLIEDSAASYVKKKVKMSNLPGGGGGLTTALASQYGRSIQGALFTYLDSSYNLKLMRTRQSLLWPGPRARRDGNVTFATIKSNIGQAGQIIRDADGDLHTCYADSNGYACHAISDDNGESWTENVAESGIWVDGVYLGIGHDGTLHMVYGGYSSQYRLRYRSSANKGTTWSSYATLDSDATANFTAYPVSIIVRTNGNIHVLYCNQVDMREAVYTTSWASANIHTGAGSIQYGSGPAVYDAVNDVIISSHVEYDYTSGTLTAVLIMKRIAGASWTSPLDIGDGVPISMVVDRLGDAHLLVEDVDWGGGYDATLYYHKYDHNTATWMTAFELDDTDGYNSYNPYTGVISVGHDDVLHVILKKIKAGTTGYSNYYLRKPPGAEWDMMDEMQISLVSTDTPLGSVCEMAPYVVDEMCQDDALIWDEEQEAWINRPMQNRPDKDLIQVENGSISSDVALTTANTFYDGPSVDLGPGYWIVTAHATYYRNATTAAHITARITDKTNHYASQQQYHESLSGITRAFSMQCTIQVYEKTTIYLQMTSSAGGASGVMRASTPNNSSGNNATQITAVKYRGLPA